MHNTASLPKTKKRLWPVHVCSLGILVFAVLITAPRTEASMVIGTVSLPARVSPQVLADTPLGWWTMDAAQISGSTITDLGTGAHNGTMNGGQTQVTGQIVGAIQFDGSNRISTNLPTSATTNITFSAWVYSTAANSGSAILYNGVNTSTDGYGFWLSGGACDSGSKVGILLGGVNCDVLSSSYVLPQNKWVFLVGTRDTATWRLYVDGSLKVTGGTTNPLTPTANFSMGWNSFIGKLDDVRFYTRVLSADEIKRLYTVGLRGISTATIAKPKSSTLDTDSALKGWWTFDTKDCGATYCIDKSGNGNTATKVGNPTLDSGKIGQSYSNNRELTSNLGTNAANYYSIPNNIVTGEATFSMWTRQFDTNVYSGTCCDTAIANKQYSLGLRRDSNTYSFRTDNDIGLRWAIYGPKHDKNWHHVVGTYSTTAHTMAIYFDGVLQQSTDTTGATPLATGGFLGKIYSNVDDVRIYNRALSASEVSQLYLMGTRALTSAVPKSATTNLATNLLGWWTFDGKECGFAYCVDKSGNGKTATLSGTSRASGKIGQALSFNGTSDVVTMPTSITSLDNNNFTVVAWVKPATNAAMGIVSRGGGGAVAGAGGWAIKTDVFIAKQSTGSTAYQRSNSSTLAVGKWSMVAVTGKYSTTDTSSSVHYFTNGLLTDGTETNTAQVATDSAYTPRIGSRGDNADAATNFFSGQIDDVRIYNRALSAGEVLQLYKLGQ